MERIPIRTAISLAVGVVFSWPAGAQEVLPFPPKSSASVAGRTMQEATYSPLPPVSHLPKDAPFKFNGTIEQARVEYLAVPTH
jgi:hypothetical protein